MRLRQLVQPLLTYKIFGETNPDIQGITTDSRQVMPGALFAAIPGFTVDGHTFAKQAVERGAAALLVQHPIDGIPADIPQVIVADTRYVSALFADALMGHPSRRLRMIGVTGTNGKTTVTYLIRHMLEHAGHVTGLIGTLGAKYRNQEIPVPNTTPEAVSVQRILRTFVESDCSHAVMEVSSHALVEGRAAGVEFGIAVYTNLSQDHLDFHETMDAYAAAKSLLFSRLGNRFVDSAGRPLYAVINADDVYARVMMDATTAPVLTYGIDADADVRASNVSITAAGLTMRVTSPVGDVDVTSSCIGRFNVYNLLATIAVGLIEDIPLSDIVSSIATYPGVPGRCERVDAGQPFGVFVDYAHTPDGLDNVLRTVRELTTGKLIVVVGCGGDRDKTKRPVMAATALKWADVCYFTSDNPRSEDPEAILDDMMAGVSEGERDRIHRLADRRTAIRNAVSLAEPGDIVVIAGKGHEDYQIIGRQSIHFDDREEARLAIQRLPDGQGS